MKIEYEAMFPDVDKEEIRKKLEEIGAKLVKPETLMKRIAFFLPKEIENEIGYFRVRDEGDGKITMTLKLYKGSGIRSERESEIEVKDFDQACQLAKDLGMKQKGYQENKREIWELDSVEIMIDTWPFIPTYVEVEGGGENEVKKISDQLGFEWSSAHFGASAWQIVNKKYGISQDDINNKIPILLFDMENPFEKFKKDNDIKNQNNVEIIFRDIEVGDFDIYEKMLSPDKRYREFNGPYFVQDTKEDISKQIKKYKEKLNRKEFPVLENKKLVVNIKNNEIIGEVNWYWKSEETNWMELGIVIFNEDYWGRGLGFSILSKWITEKFEENINLVRLGITTWSGNFGMIKLAEKTGMKKEAVYRKARIVNGEYFDSVSYGILRDEWAEKNKNEKN